jgi:diguanylate cyclase (GGDEF)-like protein
MPAFDGPEGRSYPLPENEEKRLALLREFDFLYEDEHEALARLCDMGLELLKSRTCSVTLVDRHSLRFLKRAGAPVRLVPRCDAMCTYTILGDELLEIRGLQSDPRFANLTTVRNPPYIDFYAGVPLIFDGFALGAFCITDDVQRTLSEDERRHLTWLASLVVDVMRLHHLSQKLRRREGLLAQSSQLARIGGWEADPETLQLFFSDELYRINGMEPGHQAPTELLRGLCEADRKTLDDAIRALGSTGRAFDIEAEFVDAGRIRRWARVMGEAERRDGKVVRLFGAVQDITERKSAEARIHHLAHHDPLTGLANRSLFRKRLDAAIEESAQDGSKFALMLLDFDNFKNVNDTRGHAVGDRLLETAAARLRNILGPPSTIARLGGDEFALIVRNVRDENDVIEKAEQVVQTLMRPIDLGEETLVSGVSVGVTMFPKDDREASELLKNADIALYLAKSSGRARAGYFTPALRQKFEERLALIEEVRAGIAAGQFSLHYQPICSVTSGRRGLRGFEGLMRWQHPRLGLLTPAFFGAAFEDTELAEALGEIGLTNAITRIQEWHAAGVEFGYVALNVSAAQIATGEFLRKVADRVRGVKLPRSSLMLEVTESVYLSTDASQISADLAMLHDLGVSIALDDFGTGYASLTHLKQFPVDLMKIDRSFVRQIGIDSENTAIARAVINLGRALGIDIVAEGVETADQAAFLSDNGCDSMQGYLFAQAMPGGDVAKFVRQLTASRPKSRRRAAS